MHKRAASQDVESKKARSKFTAPSVATAVPVEDSPSILTRHDGVFDEVDSGQDDENLPPLTRSITVCDDRFPPPYSETQPPEPFPVLESTPVAPSASADVVAPAAAAVVAPAPTQLVEIKEQTFEQEDKFIAMVSTPISRAESDETAARVASWVKTMRRKNYYLPNVYFKYRAGDTKTKASVACFPHDVSPDAVHDSIRHVMFPPGRLGRFSLPNVTGNFKDTEYKALTPFVSTRTFVFEMYADDSCMPVEAAEDQQKAADVIMAYQTKELLPAIHKDPEDAKEAYRQMVEKKVSTRQLAVRDGVGARRIPMRAPVLEMNGFAPKWRRAADKSKSDAEVRTRANKAAKRSWDAITTRSDSGYFYGLADREGKPLPGSRLEQLRKEMYRDMDEEEPNQQAAYGFKNVHVELLGENVRLSAQSLLALQSNCSDWVFAALTEIPRLCEKEPTSVGFSPTRILLFGRMEGGMGGRDSGKVDPDMYAV